MQNNQYDHNNIFAKILRKEIPCDVFMENDIAIAFRDINPCAKVHMLVIPKGEFCDFHDFVANADKKIVADFFEFVHNVVSALGLAESGFRLISNAGCDANQEVAHFHVHILGGENLGKALDKDASVAQLDRASPSGGEGRRFESSRTRQ